MRSRSVLVPAGLLLGLAIVSAMPALAEDVDGAPTVAACEPSPEVGRIEPPDAQGTTFVGTYAGDAVAANDDPRALLSAWDVERVYAGGPLPRDLVFQTPGCGWTNLTPGVRYLFSTSATDLAGTGAAAARPSSSDSLAWELLPDDAVRIAPFDTGAAADYASEELHAITTFEDALWSVAPEGGEGTAPTEMRIPDLDCPAPSLQASPEDARGTTFLGLYVADQQLPGPAAGDVRTYWAIDRVFAGGPLPEILTMRSPGCAASRLEAGHRYLFSTADPFGPTTGNSLAWELADDGGVLLAPFGSLDAADYPAEVRALTTREAVLAAVAPDTGVGQAPERASDRTPG